MVSSFVAGGTSNVQTVTEADPWFSAFGSSPYGKYCHTSKPFECA